MRKGIERNRKRSLRNAALSYTLQPLGHSLRVAIKNINLLLIILITGLFSLNVVLGKDWTQ